MSDSKDGTKSFRRSAHNKPTDKIDLREMHAAHLQSALQGTATACFKLLESPDRDVDEDGNTIAHRRTVGERWQPLYREVTSLLRQLSNQEQLSTLVAYITSSEKYPRVESEKFAKHLWGIQEIINSIYDLLDPKHTVDLFNRNFPRECPPPPFDREECIEWLDKLCTFAREFLPAYNDLRHLFLTKQIENEPPTHPWLMRVGKIPDVETGIYL